MTSLHTDCVERGGHSLRVVDWYLGLNFGQKIVVGVAAAASVLLASYFASLLILSPSERGEGAPPRAGTPSPESSSASASASASASSAPVIALKIERARWEGDKAVVEGTWRGTSPRFTATSWRGAKRSAPSTGETARLRPRSRSPIRASPRNSSAPRAG